MLKTNCRIDAGGTECGCFIFLRSVAVCNYVIHEKCRTLVVTPCTSYLTDHIKVRTHCATE